jgi:integrase
VLSCAADRGLIAVNVCQRGGRLYEPDRAEIIWTAADIAAFCMAAPFELQLALMLALWTGQRQSDLIRLTWMQYDGTRIRLRQGKGRRRVVIPVGAPLRAALDAVRRNEGTILRQHLRRAVDERRVPHQLRQGVRARRPRRPALPRSARHGRLALAGCTVAEIAAIRHRGGDPRGPLPGRQDRACGAGHRQARREIRARTTVNKKLQTVPAVPIWGSIKPLISLVGAQGLEPWTR